MGFKKRTELINVSGTADETAANTFTQLEVSLDLDPLNREVFIVTDCYLDPFTPSSVPATNTQVGSSLTNVSRASLASIGDSQCISNVADRIFGGAGEFNFARINMPIAQQSTGSPRDYLAIISTPNFFVQVQGTNNTGALGVHFRLTGYRAQADADTYAALVASEVLSV
jgi:hypothetical protein